MRPTQEIQNNIPKVHKLNYIGTVPSDMKHNIVISSSNQGMDMLRGHSAHHRQVVNITTPGFSNLQNITNIRDLLVRKKFWSKS